MSGRGLTDKDLEELLYLSSDSESEDHIEIEDFSSDSDDSVGDPDFSPGQNDVEEAFENNLINTWSGQRTTRISEKQKGSELSQAGLSAPSTSVSFIFIFNMFYIQIISF